MVNGKMPLYLTALGLAGLGTRSVGLAAVHR